MNITANFLCQDEGYRWRDDITDEMGEQEILEFLTQESNNMADQEEWDVVYGIYRELVWRFPNDIHSWEGLGNVAMKLSRFKESEVAFSQAKRLANSVEN